MQSQRRLQSPGTEFRIMYIMFQTQRGTAMLPASASTPAQSWRLIVGHRNLAGPWACVIIGVDTWPDAESLAADTNQPSVAPGTCRKVLTNALEALPQTPIDRKASYLGVLLSCPPLPGSSRSGTTAERAAGSEASAPAAAWRLQPPPFGHRSGPGGAGVHTGPAASDCANSSIRSAPNGSLWKQGRSTSVMTCAGLSRS